MEVGAALIFEMASLFWPDHELINSRGLEIQHFQISPTLFEIWTRPFVLFRARTFISLGYFAVALLQA